jgi:ribosome-associated toxin RatA of RatAB toxin-antitoxin module
VSVSDVLVNSEDNSLEVRVLASPFKSITSAWTNKKADIKKNDKNIFFIVRFS